MACGFGYLKGIKVSWVLDKDSGEVRPEASFGIDAVGEDPTTLAETLASMGTQRIKFQIVTEQTELKA